MACPCLCDSPSPPSAAVADPPPGRAEGGRRAKSRPSCGETGPCPRLAPCPLALVGPAAVAQPACPRSPCGRCSPRGCSLPRASGFQGPVQHTLPGGTRLLLEGAVIVWAVRSVLPLVWSPISSAPTPSGLRAGLSPGPSPLSCSGGQGLSPSDTWSHLATHSLGCREHRSSSPCHAWLGLLST